MRALIYKWHRRLSIIIAIPVFLWAASGFMHPLMTNIKPRIASQRITAVPVDSHRIHVPLQTALTTHHIDSIAGFRLIHIDTNWFYQVQPAWKPGAKTPATPIYLSCTNGNVLAAGDWLYAQYLARQFLEGPSTDGPSHHDMHDMPSMNPAQPAEAVHDCCGAASDFVLNAPKGSKVANVSGLTAFDAEYKSINRLLPVYRVSFERSDNIRIYVETTQDRFAFAMDNKRAIFDEIFRYLHTYGWLEWLGKGRLAVELLLALTALVTTIMGVYIFFITKTKKANGNSLLRARRNHRWVSIVAALFTAMWTFSGAYHAFAKFTDDTRDQYFVKDNFATTQLTPNLSRLLSENSDPLTNIGIVKLDTTLYYRITDIKSTSYINTNDYTKIAKGDRTYAAYLATKFSGHPISDTLSTTLITAFVDEYNFTDKRLPVWKIAYKSSHNERLYIETSTGRLASRVDDQSVKEGWSFSIFHKHHFMDWGGKTTRDASTMFWGFAQLVMVAIGLILYFRSLRRRKS